MALLSPVLRSLEGNRLAFICPGCNTMHSVSIAPDQRPRWDYDGNATAPTFTPSVLIKTGHMASAHKPGDSCWCTFREEHPTREVRSRCGVCHFYVRAGKLQFLDDCTHDLKGQTVEMVAF